MDVANLDGIQLEYEVCGAGEPVILIHAGVFGEWFKPLMEELALKNRYRLVRYHRVGYSGSSHLSGMISIADHAKHLHKLMRHLGITRAHLVGHSSSGNIALQFALDFPDAVQSIALLEPALHVTKNAEQRAAAIAVVMKHYRNADAASAIDAFLQMTTGSNYRGTLDQKLPNAFKQAVADADSFLGQELPALQQWSFTEQDAQRISQPVLAVIGEKDQDVPVWKERQNILLDWLPNVVPFVLPNATHLLHVENPQGMAEGLANFFLHHPISN
jgi:pimeloyl-ACP methyl ester carboxylesterase